MTLHDEAAHHLLAPHDLERHLPRDHGEAALWYVGNEQLAWARRFLAIRGIEPDDNPRVAYWQAVHESLHVNDETGR